MRGMMAAAVLAVTISFPAYAQDIREERVQFDAGRSGTTISGRIKGYEIVDYLLGASAGQHISIDFQSGNPSGYFNFLPANSDTAIFVGSSDGNRYTGALSAGGDYRIRVYLMRNAARRNEVTTYTLAVDIQGKAAETPAARGPDYADGLSGGPDYWSVANLAANDTLNVRAGPGAGHEVVGRRVNGDRVRNLGCRMAGDSRWCQIEADAGRTFVGWVNGRYLVESAYAPQNGVVNSQASGHVPCSIAAGQPTTQCPFRATHGGNGNASVWIEMSAGRERYIEFKAGEPAGSDPGLAVSFERLGDLTLIRIGGVERYDIPDAVVFGG